MTMQPMANAIFSYAIVYLRPFVAGLSICQPWLFPSSQKDSGRVPDAARHLENCMRKKANEANGTVTQREKRLEFCNLQRKHFNYLPNPSNSLAGCCGQTSCFQYLVCLALVLCHSRQIFCSRALRQQS